MDARVRTAQRAIARSLDLPFKFHGMGLLMSMALLGLCGALFQYYRMKILNTIHYLDQKFGSVTS